VRGLGFSTWTPIQALALPPLLSGRDVVARARTGSGKTVAFALGLLARVDVAVGRPQALVVCPTRELAEQVAGVVRSLARFTPHLRVVTLCGGVPARAQMASLQTTPHVVVGTPGRLLDLLGRGALDLAGVAVVVLDEADRMLDMGFFDPIAELVSFTPTTRQTLLFSATFSDEVRALATRFQRDAVEVTAEDAVDESADITQLFCAVDDESARLAALEGFLSEHRPTSCIVFVETRDGVRDVVLALRRRGHAAIALHGELSQRERDEVFACFVGGSARVLVATDVAARGLDIKALGAVVSLQPPMTTEQYVHRIGRTGRAGERGLALCLVGPGEAERARPLRALAGAAAVDVPGFAAPTSSPPPPSTVTFIVDAGKKDKLRAGDLLGALTGEGGLPGSAIGRIAIGLDHAFFAVDVGEARAPVLGDGRLRVKGRTVRLRRL
jgi:ATP-independent RNA helicase DbpA